jgi:hypothetical protein
MGVEDARGSGDHAVAVIGQADVLTYRAARSLLHRDALLGRTPTEQFLLFVREAEGHCHGIGWYHGDTVRERCFSRYGASVLCFRRPLWVQATDPTAPRIDEEFAGLPKALIDGSLRGVLAIATVMLLYGVLRDTELDRK